jgi:hypothetical protein
MREAIWIKQTGEQIGWVEDGGDAARSVYEENIRQYEFSRGREIWPSIRDREGAR